MSVASIKSQYWTFAHDMTREELLRVLNFADALRDIGEYPDNLASVDARWNIISYAMRRHLEGKLLTVTSLAAAADVPYSTAMRRIDELLADELLLKRSRSKTGKSFSLHPTRRLIGRFEEYAAHFKALIADTFGFPGDDSVQSFFFGGNYMASRILSYPNAMRRGIGFDKTIRLLCPIDPTFRTLRNVAKNLEELCGGHLEVTTLPLDRLHNEIISNHRKGRSKYDIVSVDMPWLGELSENGIIRPVDDLIQQYKFNALDFHTTVWKASSYNGQRYGLPIQPTIEMLFCREDLFAEAGLEFPVTTDEVLHAAKTLHRPHRQLSGIVMNYGRGIPVGHTFIQTLADFGSPIIDLAQIGDDFDTETITGERFRPLIDTPTGRMAGEFLVELLRFCHPESLDCDWDKRIAVYTRGEAAMTYGWSVRAAAFEFDTKSPAHGNTGFLPHPTKSGVPVGSPVGGFVLALPAAVEEARLEGAWRIMEYLTRPETMKWYVQNGSLTSPRFSTSADPEVQSFSRIIRKIDQMEQAGELKTWHRPPIPEFSGIVSVLGQEVHLMLQGAIGLGDALTRAQRRVDAMMRENGRY